VEKKISMLITNLAGGGAERVNLDLAYEFKKLGYEVEFVLLKLEGKFLLEAEENFDVFDLNMSSLFKLPQKLALYIDRAKPDAVIASMWGVTAFAPIAKLISKNKPKVLLVEHSSLISQFKNAKLRTKIFLKLSTFFSYRLADKVAGVSTGVANDIRKIARLPKQQNVNTLYNPIPCKQKPFPNVLSEVDKLWSDNCFRVITVGRLIAAKDHSTLIRAFSLLKEKNNAQLIVLGEGDLEAPLQKLTEELGLQDNIVFQGFVSDPTPYYHTADLFVLSSAREGFGNVIVESLSCGTPVVSTDCEHGPAEILNNGEFGVLVPVGDEMALAEAMLQSLNKAHDTEKLINRAKDFSPEISAKRYLKLLDL